MNDAFKTLSTILPKASAQGSQPRCVILMEERAAGGSPTPLAFHFPAPDEVPPDCQGGNTGDSEEAFGVHSLLLIAVQPWVQEGVTLPEKAHSWHLH